MEQNKPGLWRRITDFFHFTEPEGRAPAAIKKGFWYRFVRNPKAMIGGIFLVVEILLVVLLPLIQGLDSDAIDMGALNKYPSSDHILGLTDSYQDVYARLVYGGQTSLIVGLLSTVIGMVIGVPLGLIAGYFGGKVDAVIMRTSEIFISFPSMVLMLLLAVIFGSNVWVVAAVIGFLGWPSVTKLIEGSALSVSKKEYIEAARTLGKSNTSILFRDILPNVITPVLVTVPFRVSGAIIAEASLSFLGLGMENSWGKSINYAMSPNVMMTEPWIWVPATVMLFVTVVAINLLGEGIRDVADPKLGKR